MDQALNTRTKLISERSYRRLKKVLYISGAVTILLIVLFLTGWADAYDSADRALRRGNGQYALAEYEDALAEYETGLEIKPENGAVNSDGTLSTDTTLSSNAVQDSNAAHTSNTAQNSGAAQSSRLARHLKAALNFNAAQAAYLLGDYEKAIKYYENAEDCVDKYLNSGNILFRAGNAAEDANQKAQCYSKALQFYREGIIKFPQNVPLKYNYETVKALLDEIQKDNESSNKDENSDQNEKEKENESEGENGNQKETQGENQENQGQENQNQESQDQKNQGQESQDQESENGESAQNKEDENSGQEENTGSAQDKDQEGNDKQQNASYSEDGEYDPDQEAIERILAVLEAQEQESLKNNQEVVGGKGGKYDW